ASTSDTKSLVTVGATVFDSTTKRWACDLRLISPLDRDTSPPVRKLYFDLKDTFPFTISVTLTLIINDINDNPPTFVDLPYRFSLPENTIVGTSVYKVTATDPDSNSGRIPNYFIEAVSGNYNHTFEVNKQTGQITLNKSLDYENLSFYHYNVSAKDEGNPTCPGVSCVCDKNSNFNNPTCDPGPVDLFITIIDVQDTPPVFSKLPYMATVAENATLGQSIFQVSAVDGDRGVSQPNHIQYTLSGADSSQFAIGSSDGIIRVKEVLDADKEEVRNKGGLYSFAVIATEESGNSTENPNNRTETPISVTVTDINDNPPKFNANNYSASVQENTPKGVPITITSSIEVVDIDQDVNSRFWVYLEKDDNPYNDFDTLPAANVVIQGRSTITIRVFNSSVLDYETTKNLTFQLIAKENNSNPNITSSSVATVTLTILDVNDNSPQFPDQPRAFNVSEDAPLGHVIATITATDADSGDFGQIVFSLEDNGLDGTFNISEQGVITLAQPLDWEERKSYTLAVISSDSPQNQDQHRQSTFRIQVNVLDVNDNAPNWAQYVEYVTVLERSAVGTKLTVLKATDLDGGLNGQIKYSIVAGTNGSMLFDVNTTKEEFAEIYIQQSLIDNVGLHILTVMAEDQGTPPLNSTLNLSIFVIDENQHYPIFVDPDQTKFNTSAGQWPEIRIPEEQPFGSALYTLNATDRDTGENGKVEYLLNPSSNKDDEYFTVDRSSGTLRSVRRLDRDTKDTYEIQVTAKDNGQPVALMTQLSVRIILLDINDNQPTYKRSDMPQKLQVVEESNNAVIGQLVEATDIDEAPNNINCYYLYGGDHLSGLQLDKKTRSLSLTTKVDREITSELNIVIKASENCNLTSDFFISNPSKANATFTAALADDPPPEYNSSDDSLLWVKVAVIDINDNPPKFTSPELAASVIYDVEIGTKVMSLADNITDKDTPDNRKNKFRLLNFTSVLQAGDAIDTSKPPFVVSNNGSVNTNMLFQKEILGHFLLYVLTYDDDGLNDTASIKVTLISSSDRLLLVFNKQVNEVEQLKANIVKQLSDILNINIMMDKIQGHVSLGGTSDPSKTDAYIHGRYRSNGKIVPATELRRLIDLSLDATGLLNSNGVIETQTMVGDKPGDPKEELQKVFIIVAVILAVIVVSLFLVLLYMINLYRRRLSAATTSAYAPPQEKDTIEHPGTNKYFASENPLFGREIKAFDHPDVDDNDDGDVSSHNSLDLNGVDPAVPYKSSQPAEADEEQEMSMQIGDGVLPVAPFNRSSNLDNVLQAYTNQAYTHDNDDIDGHYSHLDTKNMAPISKGEDSKQGQQFSDNDLYDEIYKSRVSDFHLEYSEI
ncbi:unnamed protein product, partial [Candidula unifasciata]